MARVNIKKARVDRIIPGYGFVAISTFQKRNGEEGREYFTIWTKDPVQEGQVFDVSGLLSVKVEEWTDKTTGEPRSRAAVSVNDPILKAPDDSPEPVKHLTLDEAFGDVKVVSANEEAPF